MAMRFWLVGLLGCAACGVVVPVGPTGAAADADAGVDAAVAEVVADATDVAADMPSPPDIAADLAETAAPKDALPEVVADVVDSAAPKDAEPEVAADAAIGIAPAGMVLIPAGTFWMGCNAVKDPFPAFCKDTTPQHKVTLSAYYMDLTETTVSAYQLCVDAGACSTPAVDAGATYPTLTNHPVNLVNWLQARTYCQWRGPSFDLPTEAQWEMAARGSCEMNDSAANDPACAAAMRTFPWGEAMPNCTYAVMHDDALNWPSGNGCGTQAPWAVGSKLAGDSPYGIHDMAGNVSELCRDYPAVYPAGPQFDPVQPVLEKGFRSDRGGNLAADGVSVSASMRYKPLETTAGDWLGFRCIRAWP